MLKEESSEKQKTEGKKTQPNINNFRTNKVTVVYHLYEL